VSIGETIEAVVLKVDPEDEKISLGMKQTEQDPWVMLPMKYPIGTRITGKVRNLTSFGAFVEIEPGIDGLIHISDMSWTKRVQHPSEVVKKNDEVEVSILSIDPANKRISLGLKQVQEDPWLKIAEDHPVGMEMEGSIVRYQESGVVVDLGNDLEGMVPQSQLPLAEGKSVEDETQLGQQVALKVLEVDPIHHRIVLAATDFLEIPEGFVPPTPLVYDDDESSETEPSKEVKAEAAAEESAEEPADEAADEPKAAAEEVADEPTAPAEKEKPAE
jgi:small subunit ribosomal protein S1